MDREQAIREITDRLGDRKLVWFGSFGQDARSLTPIPQFSHAFSLMAPLSAAGVESLSVDELLGSRQPDYEPSSFLSGNGSKMLSAMREAFSGPVAMVTEGQSELLGYFRALGGHIDHLMIPLQLTDALRDKLAVESALNNRAGITTIPWEVLPDGEARFGVVREKLRSGPAVVRGGPHGGGSGHEVIRDVEQLAVSRILQLDAAVAVAPYLTGYVPVCIGACVFRDGGITVHPGSLQLIGLRICRTEDFGYCGNDFGAFKQLPRATIDQVEACVRAAGLWLHSQGFVGAFGVDALVRGGETIFVEINPRFQGSSRMSAELDAEMGLPDIFLDHLLAWLDAPSYQSPSLTELAAMQTPRAQIVWYNQRDEPVRLVEEGLTLPAGYRAELIPSPAVSIAAGSQIGAITTGDRVTSDGTSLFPSATAAVKAALDGFHA